MAIRFYDEALVSKIYDFFPVEAKDKITILKPNEVSRLFQVKADQKNDKPLTLPLITVARDANVGIQVKGKRAMTYSGSVFAKNKDGTLQLDAIPLDLGYQIDVYTKRYDEGDETIRNLIFQLVNHPRMAIELPYNGANIRHVCNIRIDGDLIDNSDISEHLFPDEFTRWTLTVKLDDAYLFSIPHHSYKRIGSVEVEVGYQNDIAKSILYSINDTIRFKDFAEAFKYSQNILRKIFKKEDLNLEEFIISNKRREKEYEIDWEENILYLHIKQKSSEEWDAVCTFRDEPDIAEVEVINFDNN